LQSDNDGVQPDHYAQININRPNDHYSYLSDAEQNVAQHYADLK